MLVLDGERNQFGRNGAKLYGLGGEPLRSLPDLGVLHLAAADGADQFRHHARFEVIVKNVAARKRDAACADFR